MMRSNSSLGILTVVIAAGQFIYTDAAFGYPRFPSAVESLAKETDLWVVGNLECTTEQYVRNPLELGGGFRCLGTFTVTGSTRDDIPNTIEINQTGPLIRSSGCPIVMAIKPNGNGTYSLYDDHYWFSTCKEWSNESVLGPYVEGPYAWEWFSDVVEAAHKEPEEFVSDIDKYVRRMSSDDYTDRYLAYRYFSVFEQIPELNGALRSAIGVDLIEKTELGKPTVIFNRTSRPTASSEHHAAEAELQDLFRKIGGCPPVENDVESWKRSGWLSPWSRGELPTAGHSSDTTVGQFEWFPWVLLALLTSLLIGMRVRNSTPQHNRKLNTLLLVGGALCIVLLGLRALDRIDAAREPRLSQARSHADNGRYEEAVALYTRCMESGLELNVLDALLFARSLSESEPTRAFLVYALHAREAETITEAWSWISEDFEELVATMSDESLREAESQYSRIAERQQRILAAGDNDLPPILTQMNEWSVQDPVTGEPIQ